MNAFDGSDRTDWVPPPSEEYQRKHPDWDKQPEPPPPETIDGDWWLTRDLPRPAPILGEIICASTRALFGGPTGAGKTHFAMAMAGAIATGRGYLHWLGPAKPLVVLYVDGEMARDLMQDRVRDLHRRVGKPSFANLHVLCREDFPAMQGLNTEAGQKFLLDFIDRIHPDVVFLDNRMALTVGDMKEEVTWTDTMPLVLALTRKRIAQIWLDHTGHNGEHIYGSKTKEWQMDLVALFEDIENKGDADVSFKLKFTKARRRRPDAREDFNTGTITLREDEWSWVPADQTAEKGAKRGRPISDETELLRRAIINLAADESVVPTVVHPGMKPVRAVSLSIARVYLITNGWFTESIDYSDPCGDGKVRLSKKGLNRLSTALKTLERQGICGHNRDLVWPI